MKIQVTEEEKVQLYEWQRRFEKADNIKRLAFELFIRYKVPVDLLDKRVDFAWSKVKEVEPFPTFVKGELTVNAAGLLARIKLDKIWEGSVLKVKR